METHVYGWTTLVIIVICGGRVIVWKRQLENLFTSVILTKVKSDIFKVSLVSRDFGHYVKMTVEVMIISQPCSRNGSAYEHNFSLMPCRWTRISHPVQFYLRGMEKVEIMLEEELVVTLVWGLWFYFICHLLKILNVTGQNGHISILNANICLWILYSMYWKPTNVCSFFYLTVWVSDRVLRLVKKPRKSWKLIDLSSVIVKVVWSWEIWAEW